MKSRQTRKTPPRNTSDPFTDWARAVVAGEVVQGPHVRNSCRRHLDDLVNGRRRGLRWDLEAAFRPCQFFEEVLRLNGGQFEGIPFVLDISQAFVLASLFGWKQADGRRRFRRAYIETGKGNGKSPFLAGIGLYCMMADDEKRSEVYAAGSKRDQAMVLFRDAVAMRNQSPGLRRRIVASGVQPVWNLADLTTGSFFRPIASADGQSGPRPHCALCDEVHEHTDGTVIDMLEAGFKFRRQPFLVMATNAGTDRNSVCWREHLHGVCVAAGTRSPDADFTYVGEVIDDSSFSFVCALDKDDDPLEDPSCWVKANPLLGKLLTEDYLAGVVGQAKAIPGKLGGILRLHFCVWTDAVETWMSRAALEPCLATFDTSRHAGAEAYLGVDLSAVQDLTAAAVVVPTGAVEALDEASGRTVLLPTYDAWIEAWTPADTLDARALSDKAPYDVWARDGWLHTTPGTTIRMDFVAARIAEICAELRVGTLAYDRYTYRRLQEELEGIGVSVAQAEHPQGGKRRAKATDEAIDAAKRHGREAPQGLWMPGSLLELENLILTRRLRLLASPVLISAIMSAAIERDPFDNRWFSKRKAVNRIDPLIALAMAIGAAAQASQLRTDSTYERRGVLVI